MATEKRRQGTNKLPFSSILRKLMNERDLSVRAVAEMAGVSPSVIQSWISSANPHDLVAVGKLAKALNLSLRELLLGETEHSQFESSNIKDIFEEKDFFEGICKVSIQRLIPKKGGK